jgi:hypothetical protein
VVGAGAELRRRHRVFVDPRELERATGLIMLGTVPWVRHERELKPASDYRLAIEAIGLRLRRLLEPSGDPGSIVAVLSSVPDEGKSTLSLALARWFAAAEQRVLLVDADLRRPSIRQLLHDEAAVEVSRGWGFHRLVSDRAAVIDVLAPSDPPAAASALLATLPSLLDTARQTYDVVLVDTPPLLAASDALAVAGSSDQILFPVRWASTSKASVAFALRELAPDLRAKTRLVFSMVERQGYRAYGAPGAEGYRRSRGRWHDRKLVRGPLHALAPSAEHGGEERC